MGSPRLTVVVPCFNEEQALPACAAALERWLGTRPDGEVEVLFVDDGSRDGTWRVISELTARRPAFSGIRLMTNRGSHVALRCGYQEARGQRVVNLPVDLQEPVENIDRLMRTMDETSADGVLAVRQSRGDGVGTRLGSRFYHWALRWAGLRNIPVQGAAQFLLAPRVVKQINAIHDRGFTLDGFLASAPLRLEVVPYDRAAVDGRTSRWSLAKKVQHALDTLLGFSHVPIRTISAIGVLAAVAGALYALFLVVWVALLKGGIPGWGSLMCAVLVLGGLNLLALGMLGEYAWRILDEAHQRPLYQVEERAGGAGPSGSSEKGTPSVAARSR